MSPSDDIVASITEFQNTSASLQKLADDAQAAEDKPAMEAATAAAAKFRASISALGGSGSDTRAATQGSGNKADDIPVRIDTNAAINLPADEYTMIAAHHG